MESTPANNSIELLLELRNLDQLLEGVNDYGDSTGFLEERDQIVQDFKRSLTSIHARAATLRRRINSHTKNETTKHCRNCGCRE